MNVETIHEYCMSKPGTTEEFPFDEVTLVFKVMGKAYLFTGLDQEECRLNLKCDPERAIELREEYEDIIPGYHMNKKHWNSVYTERGLSNEFILELIDHSYDLVVAKLPKTLKLALKELSGM